MTPDGDGAERNVSRAGGWWMLLVLVGAGVVVVAALYGLRYAWFYAGQASVPAVGSAPEPAVAEEDRAWPAYRDALLAMGFPFVESRGSGRVRVLLPGTGAGKRWLETTGFNAWTVLGDDGWPEVAAYVRRFPGEIETLREATRRPVLGLPVWPSEGEAASPAWEAEPVQARDLLLQTAAGPGVAGAAALERPASTSLVRRVARVLQADLMEAAAAGDRGRVRADADALFDLAEQVGLDEAARVDPVLLLAAQHAMEALDRAVRFAPGGFTAEDLAAIDARLAALDAFGFATPEAAARTTRAALERSFTDDGDGSGRIVPEAAARLRRPSGLPAVDEKLQRAPEAAMRLLRPLLTLDAAGREETAGLLDRWAARNAAEWAQPLHARWTLSADDELGTLAADPRDARRFRWLLDTAGSLSAARRRAFACNAHRDATRLLLHLGVERLRGGTGAWPDPGVPYGAGAPAPAEVFGRPLPADPLTGGPIHWTLYGEEVVLYSLGADGDDDRGRSSDLPPFGAFADPTAPAATRPDGDWVLIKARGTRRY